MRARCCLGLMLLGVWACDSRPVPAADGALDVRADGAPGSDVQPRPDATLHTCKKLVALGATPLGPKTENNARPAMVHDGIQFGVAWLYGKDFSATSPATLRFTRVDSAGKAHNAEGVKVGAATSVVQPALAYGGAEYAVLYRGPSPAITDVTVLARLRPDGTSKHKALAVAGASRSLALARSGNGYAALMAQESKSSDRLVFARIDAKGTVTTKIVQSAGGYWLPWLSPRTGGYVAGWGGVFARLGPDGALQHTTMLNNGMSQVYATSAVGYSVAYISYSGPSKDNVQLQLLDTLGKPVGPPQVAGGNSGFGAKISRYIALVWTGGMHIVVYSRYSSGGSQQVVAQLLDAQASPVGGPVAMPVCTSKPAFVDLAAAWGKDTLAVTFIGSTSKSARLCVSRMRCQP